MTLRHRLSSVSIWLKYSIFFISSSYSACSLFCCRPVSCDSRISTMALLCISSSPKRSSSARCAAAGVWLCLMMRTTSSMLSLAMMSPRRMCTRSSALRRSYLVRRMTTSWRCSTKLLMKSRSVSNCGRPLTSAMLFTLKLVCMGVILKSLFSTTRLLVSRFTSITMRIPSRSLSSLALCMPSIFFSCTSCAIYSMSCCLFTP